MNFLKNNNIQKTVSFLAPPKERTGAYLAGLVPEGKTYPLTQPFEHSLKNTLFLLSFILCLVSCKQESYIYEVNDLTIESNNSDKGKEKSISQYFNILYANLYQKPLSPNQLVDLTAVATSIGDKQVAFETIVAKMMTDPDIQLPSKSSMEADIPAFVTDTYKRFYVRIPTEAEKTYFVNFIESHPNIGPEHIYFSFATSDEYYYY